MTEIPFIVHADSAPSADTKGWPASVSGQVLKFVAVDVLRRNLRELSLALTEALDDIATVGQFRLAEVQVQAEVTAEGGIQLIGSGKLAAKGAITLRFVVPGKE